MGGCIQFWQLNTRKINLADGWGQKLSRATIVYFLTSSGLLRYCPSYGWWERYPTLTGIQFQCRGRMPPTGLQLLAAGCAGITLLQTGLADFLGINQLTKNNLAQPTLMTGGFYKWVRHPLYTFSIIFLLATPQMTQNWAAFAVGTTLYFYIGAIYEERKLEHFYGDSYAAYKKRTPMLIPGARLKK